MEPDRPLDNGRTASVTLHSSMGILDDAIREHLELKRQHGADDDDVERLEKEAFGPPARPGDPEFDTSEGQVVPDPEAAAEAPSADPEAPEAVVPAPEAEEAPAADGADASSGIFDAESGGEEDWLASLEDVVETPPEEEPAVEQSQAPAMDELAAEAPVEPTPEPAPEADVAEGGPDVGLPSTRPEEDEITPAEQARIEHADLGDTVAHEAVPARSEEEPPEPSSAPPEAPESAIFDQDSDEDFGDLDLDLDDEEPAASAEPAAPISDERAVEPEPTSTEMELPPAPVQPPADDFETGTDDFEIDEEEEDELEDDDEDLLEETPDFLQDAPEGERLWFEQGAPKDFDFDDDDED